MGDRCPLQVKSVDFGPSASRPRYPLAADIRQIADLAAAQHLVETVEGDQGVAKSGD
jgi:hypothetical protein